MVWKIKLLSHNLTVIHSIFAIQQASWGGGIRIGKGRIGIGLRIIINFCFILLFLMFPLGTHLFLCGNHQNSIFLIHPFNTNVHKNMNKRNNSHKESSGFELNVISLVKEFLFSFFRTPIDNKKKRGCFHQHLKQISFIKVLLNEIWRFYLNYLSWCKISLHQPHFHLQIREA